MLASVAASRRAAAASSSPLPPTTCREADSTALVLPLAAAAADAAADADAAAATGAGGRRPRVTSLTPRSIASRRAAAEGHSAVDDDTPSDASSVCRPSDTSSPWSPDASAAADAGLVCSCGTTKAIARPWHSAHTALASALAAPLVCSELKRSRSRLGPSSVDSPSAASAAASEPSAVSSARALSAAANLDSPSALLPPWPVTDPAPADAPA